MALTVDLQVNNSPSPAARYVTWAPSLCRIRVTNPSGTTTPTVSVKLGSVSAAAGGAVVFRSGTSGFSRSSRVPFPDAVTLSIGPPIAFLLRPEPLAFLFASHLPQM